MYEEKLKGLLTPLDEVLKNRNVFSSEDGIGAVLLLETVDYLADDGKIYIVEHFVAEALTEEGSKGAAKETFTYQKSNSRIFLVEAQTILPDGQKLPVQQNATLLKSPQNDSDRGLYDDNWELIVMYPNVGVGAVTQSIVVTEMKEPRIPGEFSRRYSWANGWPRMESRRVLDLPAEVADRLKMVTLGKGVPELKKDQTESGRVRWSWRTGKSPEGPWESNMPPVFQVGPYTWVSTITDWNAVAKWYDGLLKGRETLSPELAADVDAWTKDAKSNQEIIEILTKKVSSEVRYVGLEFGLAGFQPANCNDVWSNRYGDCKDKANLLRAMLKHKGISARLVLLETEHAGIVEKRVPDYRQFDHVILTAEYEPGKWLFTDPTIRYGHAGLISPADADREVLVLDGEVAEWGRTPPVSAGKLIYEFSLKRDVRGEMTGWLDLRAEGYYATGYHEDYLGRDPVGTKRSAGEIVRYFFPAAELIDAETKLGDPAKDGFHMKAFFVVPAGGGGDAASTVKVPFHKGLLPDAMQDGKRQTSFFLWRDEIEVRMNMELPEGIQVTNVPQPYQLDSPGMHADGSWSVDGPRVSGELRVDVNASMVSAAEFPVLRNSVRSLQSWLERPVMLGAGDGASVAEVQPTATPQDITLENFPMMPTAEGQQQLLEKIFPHDGDTALRRKALTKIVQYFPQHKETQFYAAMNEVFLKEKEGKKGLAPEVEKLIAAYRGSVSRDWLEWGEYRLAFIYMENDEPAKAQAIFARLAMDDEAGEFRRAWSTFHAANLDKKQSEEAIGYLRKGILLDTGALERQLPLLAELLMEQSKLEELREPLRNIAARGTETSDAGVVAVIEYATTLPEEQAGQLLEVIETANETGSDVVAEALTKAKGRSKWKTAWRDLRSQLQEHFSEHPLTGGAPEGISREDLRKMQEAANTGMDGWKALALTAGLLTRFEPDDKFSRDLWQAASQADWIERREGKDKTWPHLTFLLNLCGEIPKDDDNYFEAQIVRGRMLQRSGEYAAAEVVLQAMLKEPTFPSDFESSTRRDLGLALESQGKYAEALEVYRPMERQIMTSSMADDMALRAVFINLHLGQQDEALALLTQLDKVPENIVQKAGGAFQIGNMTRLARNPEKAKAYWKKAAEWLEAYRSLGGKISPDFKAPEPEVVPVIQDLAALGTAASESARARNKASYLRDWNLAFSAARWDDVLAVEASLLSNSLKTLDSNLLPDALALNRKLLLAAETEGEQERQRKRLLAGNYLEMDDTDKALLEAKVFLAADSQEDAINYTMRRIQGVAAYDMPGERADAIKVLEDSLMKADATGERDYTVRVLAKLYRNENRLEDEEKLLQRELAHPTVKASEFLDELQTRQSELQEQRASGDGFDKFLAEWLAKHRPGWYDYAEPKSLESGRFSDLDEALAKPDDYFSPPEVIKFLLLAAQDKTLPFIKRYEAWDTALSRMADLFPFFPDMERFMEDVYDSPQLSDRMRARWLWVTAYAAAMNHRRELYQKCLAHPMAAHFVEVEKEHLKALGIVVEADVLSSESIEKCFNELAAGSISPVALQAMQVLFREILLLGDLETAQRMYDLVTKVRLSSEVKQSQSAVSLEFLKGLKQARRWQPVQDALRETTLRHFPDHARPEIYGDLRIPLAATQISVADSVPIYVYRMAARQVDAGDMDFWRQFGRVLSVPGTQKLRLELVSHLMEKAQDDHMRAEALTVAMSILDRDDKQEREYLLELCEPLRKMADAPATGRVLDMIDLATAKRSGDTARFEEILQGGKFNVDYLSLSYYLGQNESQKLKAAIEKADHGKVIDNWPALALQAFQAAGMVDEADLAREATRRELEKCLLSTWMVPVSEDISAVFKMAEALDEPTLVPDAWMKSMMERVEDRLTRANLMVSTARLKKDWPEMEKQALKATKEFPAFYHFYYLLGEALYHSGRKQEAVVPLKVYVNVAHDEFERLQALEWIAEVDGSATKTP